jgi:ABC-type uncharacterized transport system permease subunit
LSCCRFFFCSDSQGFCCDCGSLINLGGSSGQLTRGNLDCGGLLQTQHSASCLRLDSTWWHRVGAAAWPAVGGVVPAAIPGLLVVLRGNFMNSLSTAHS